MADKAGVAVGEEVVETGTSAKSTLQKVDKVARTTCHSLRVPQAVGTAVATVVLVAEEANTVADMACGSVALHTMSETFAQLFLAPG
jgi:hypothetical protein